jgi:hypothetical protein
MENALRAQRKKSSLPHKSRRERISDFKTEPAGRPAGHRARAACASKKEVTKWPILKPW